MAGALFEEDFNVTRVVVLVEEQIDHIEIQNIDEENDRLMVAFLQITSNSFIVNAGASIRVALARNLQQGYNYFFRGVVTLFHDEDAWNEQFQMFLPYRTELEIEDDVSDQAFWFDGNADSIQFNPRTHESMYVLIMRRNIIN